MKINRPLLLRASESGPIVKLNNSMIMSSGGYTRPCNDCGVDLNGKMAYWDYMTMRCHECNERIQTIKRAIQGAGYLAHLRRTGWLQENSHSK